jgi:hypothetical protein
MVTIVVPLYLLQSSDFWPIPLDPFLRLSLVALGALLLLIGLFLFVSSLHHFAIGTALFVQDVVPGRDTAATRRKLAVFEPDVEFHSFGLAPDMSFVVVAARQPTSNLLEIDGLPDDVAPTRPGQH